MARANDYNVEIVLDQSIFTSRNGIGLSVGTLSLCIPYLFYYT